MKKRNLLITLSLFTSLCSAQITMDSVKVYGNSAGFDSVYIQYSSYIPKINSFTYRGFNDRCGTTPVNLSFVGCSTAVSIQKDTTIVFHPLGPISSKFLKLYTVWDTSSTCSSPINPVITDSYFYDICHLTSVNELEGLASRIVLYPNPAHEFFNLEMSDGITLSRVELIDLQGSLIKIYETNATRFDLNGVAHGVYYIKISTDKGFAFKKIVVAQ